MPSDQRVHTGDHLVQFYGADERLLVDNVGGFLAEGLRNGSGALVIGTAEHNTAITAKLGRLIDNGARADARLVVLDAGRMLAQFMVQGKPDRGLFEETLGRIARSLCKAHGRFRAYGEMVGLLWTSGASSAAVELEELWNELLGSLEFDLFCAYPIDVLGTEFQIGCIDALLAAHTGLSTAIPENVEAAIKRAIVEVLGPRADGLGGVAMPIRSSWQSALPAGERTMLWLRNELPRYADEIVAKVRAYRTA